MYQEYLDYVKDYLNKHKGDLPPGSQLPFRSKFDHIKRVLTWAIRLSEHRNDIDKEALYLAAIFHDVGYAIGKHQHGFHSGEIFQSYAQSINLETALMNKVKNMVTQHSNKALLYESSTSDELIILMEADLLDEEGALRMIWYGVDKGIEKPNKYEAILDHIVMGNDKRLRNPMVTDKGKAFWQEKQALAIEFTKQFQRDIYDNPLALLGSIK